VFKKPNRDGVRSSLETRTAVKKVKQNAEDPVNGGNGTSPHVQLQIVCKFYCHLKSICKILLRKVSDVPCFILTGSFARVTNAVLVCIFRPRGQILGSGRPMPLRQSAL
jgi:hypothetical protein